MRPGRIYECFVGKRRRNRPFFTTSHADHAKTGGDLDRRQRSKQRTNPNGTDILQKLAKVTKQNGGVAAKE
jgi:hypothetical protein